jgi:hypothetical protein
MRRGKQLHRNIGKLRGRGVGPRNRNPEKAFKFRQEREQSRRLNKRLKNRLRKRARG